MGGLEIDENSVVLGSDSEAIGGLNAAGEVAGDVHGNYRSGGNSLLDCAGVARVACTRYMFDDNTKDISVAAFTSGASVEGSKSDQGHRCWR